MKTIMLVFYTDVFIGDACRFEFKIIHSVYDLVAIYLMLALSTRNFIHTVNIIFVTFVTGKVYILCIMTNFKLVMKFIKF